MFLYIMTYSLIDKLTRKNSELTEEASVIEHVGSLLNSKNFEQTESDFPELNSSILCYGLPDLSEFDSKDQQAAERVKKAIYQTLEKFEPRLKNVNVEISSIEQSIVFFSIAATLLTADSNLSVNINSKFQYSTNKFDLFQA